ncbi:putative short-chain dehydrogenase [Xylogone sp. PMI_703]|nr:putative short-chain dehydrogenase [Xylogone sp. PMI_703]
MPSYLVTGSSRGLGLGFVTHLLQNKDNVVLATARDTARSRGLQELKAQHKDGRLILIDLDVTKVESIRNAAEQAAKVLPGGLDNLISNAGVSESGALKTFDELEVDELDREVNFAISTLLLVVRGFLPLVKKSKAKRILVVTSVVGSLTIAPNILNLGIGYGVARAALNMLARKWSAPLKTDGVAIGLVHPGWVPVTDMGSSIVPWVEKNPSSMEGITVEQSATGVINVLNGLTLESSGEFFNYDGSPLPW